MNSDQQPYQDSGETVRLPAKELSAGTDQLTPGALVFGHYRLHSIAGKGGMGVVWRAQDEELNETVALKFLPEAVARDPAAIEELKDETRRARRLRHGNIVSVFNFEREMAHTAVSMEFVDGQTMSHLRLEQPDKVFAVEALAPFVTQLCAALDYAHLEAKVVHRDLKPANLMLTREGVLKVTDFGIARSIADTATRATGRAGDSSGTLPYMSPQQVNGRKPTAADDIYALGATLYELLTGKPPFHRGDPYSLMNQIANVEPLRLSEMRAELEFEGPPIPAIWEETIAACLAKQPEQRPPSAGKVARLLQLSSVQDAAVSAAPFSLPKSARKKPTPVAAPGDQSRGGPKQSRPWAWVKWLVGAVTIAGLAAYLLGYLPIPRPWIPVQVRQEQIEYTAILQQIASMSDNSSLEDFNKIESAVKTYVEHAPVLYRPEVNGEWEKRKNAWLAAKVDENIKAKNAKELNDFTNIKARIESVVDGMLRDEVDTIGKAVRDYLVSAPDDPNAMVPEGYKAHVDAAWKKQQLKWETAQQRTKLERQAAEEAARILKEKEALADIKERIAALPDGSSREVFDAVAAAVKDYAAVAPKDNQAEVNAAWAKRKSAWEAAAEAERRRAAEQAKAEQEKNSYEAILKRIGTAVDGSPRDDLMNVGSAVHHYLATAPERYKSEVAATWDKRQSAWEAARIRLEKEREQREYEAITKRIGTAADGSPRDQLAVVGSAVQAYVGSAPERFKNTVTTAWAKRQAGWETARLAAYRGEFFLNTNPDGAEVRVDGQLLAERTPLTVGKQKLGRHQVRVQLPGYEEWTNEVVVAEGITPQMEIPLVRSLGKVTLTGTPGAEVFYESRRLGKLPQTIDKVPTGPVHFRVQARGYKTADISGEVVRNEELQLNAALVLKTVEPGQPWLLLDLNLELRPIAPGAFTMGSESGDGDEKPVTRVTLTRPFWLGKTEVTQAQWQAVMGNNPSEHKGADLPVENVNWDEAMEFCRKLTARELAAGRLSAGYAYTLPTEAQWEYACRAGTTGDFAGQLDAIAWFAPIANVANGHSNPVGIKQANAWGLHDMHGNVAEWCLDWYGKYTGGSATDPNNTQSSWRGHVRRGGSFGDGERFVTSSRRSAYKLRTYTLGFRLAISSAP